jgi:hypothetical protein
MARVVGRGVPEAVLKLLASPVKMVPFLEIAGLSVGSAV